MYVCLPLKCIQVQYSIEYCAVVDKDTKPVE